MMINILTKANPVSSEKWNNFKAFIRPYFGQEGIRLANELPGMKLPLDYKTSSYLKRLLTLDFSERSSRCKFPLIVGSLVDAAGGEKEDVAFFQNMAELPLNLFQPSAKYFTDQLTKTIKEHYQSQGLTAPDFIAEHKTED